MMWYLPAQIIYSLEIILLIFRGKISRWTVRMHGESLYLSYIHVFSYLFFSELFLFLYSKRKFTRVAQKYSLLDNRPSPALLAIGVTSLSPMGQKTYFFCFLFFLKHSILLDQEIQRIMTNGFPWLNAVKTSRLSFSFQQVWKNNSLVALCNAIRYM